METHDLYGPSSIDRRLGCPGSAALEAKCPPSDSEDALEGTRLHHLVAIGDCSEDLSKRALDWLETMAPIMEWSMEVPLELRDADGTVLTHGTADAVWQNLQHAIIPDHKFGYKIPAPEVLLRQVAMYPAMKLSMDKHLVSAKGIARYHRYGKTIECTVTREDVPKIIAWWKGVKGRCEAEPEVYTPGDWCLYCRGRTSARCPALFQEAKVLSLSTVQELQPAELERMATLLDYEERLAPFFKAAREHVRRAIQQGAVVPGWAIQPRAAPRKVRDPNEVYAALQDSLLPSEVLSACSVSVTALEKVYCDKQSQLTTLPKARLKELFNARISPCLEKSGPVICLVRKEATNG